MRKVEQQLISALRSQKNFRSGNTTVDHTKNDQGDLVGRVQLHGNTIAFFTKSLNQLVLFDGSWTSRTTQSRLNALLSEFTFNYRIIQKDYQWYIKDTSYNTITTWIGRATFRAGTFKY